MYSKTPIGPGASRTLNMIRLEPQGLTGFFFDFLIHNAVIPTTVTGRVISIVHAFFVKYFCTHNRTAKRTGDTFFKNPSAPRELVVSQASRIPNSSASDI